MKQIEILALIPARGNSKSIPKKNIRKFSGYPLIAYSITAALRSNHITRVIVSTDNEEIVSYSWNFADGWKDEGQVVKHRFLWAGTYNVALTVTDNDGGKTTHLHEINVMGGPPCNADLESTNEWNAGGHK